MTHQHDHSAVPARRLASYQASELVAESERSQVARRSTWVSVAVNIILVIFQIIVGVFAQSQALIADAIHSLSDIFSDFVVLFANRHAARAADAGHPFGHRRFETIASLAIGLIMLGVGLAMVWSAGLRLTDPSTIPTVHMSALFVAISVLMAKELLFRYMLNQAQRVRSALLVANAWHARSDAASSLVVGIGILANIAGFPMADPLAALLVGAMIARMGGKFSLRALSDLADHAVDDEIEQQIRQALHDTPNLQGFHDLKTRKSGDMVLVEVHLEFPSDMTILAAHDISELACARIMQIDDILQVTTHFDPVTVAPADTGREVNK
ncbi:cation diffusion facilitator family transporter [Advenella sp. FME57]|uniref:cation diffusion facilitator family transporter n=1 Tax=Advenella sp. FME57 TaxID=2742604 RepID=UPI001867F609|nr:cation diffusion facilitator family transporter [Advenella sp. FME57]